MALCKLSPPMLDLSNVVKWGKNYQVHLEFNDLFSSCLNTWIQCKQKTRTALIIILKNYSKSENRIATCQTVFKLFKQKILYNIWLYGEKKFRLFLWVGLQILELLLLKNNTKIISVLNNIKFLTIPMLTFNLALFCTEYGLYLIH